jgi:basic membrane protein A
VNHSLQYSVKKSWLVLFAILLAACSIKSTPNVIPQVEATEVSAKPTEALLETTEVPVEPTQTPAEEAMLEEKPTEPASEPVRIGLVTDMEEIDHSVWNADAWKGIQMAQEQFGYEAVFLESTQESDYTPNINLMIEDGYNLIVTVGASMGDVTRNLAEQNPEVNFIILGHAYDVHLKNVLAVTFANDKAAFLAGYLAAGMTQSKKVATFGGMDVPPVKAYIVGFDSGVKYYNQVHSTQVEVLGVDRFTGGFDTESGRQAAEDFLISGADIVMPVAGGGGQGAGDAVLDHPGTMLIGVDFDWCTQFEQYCPVVLTSAYSPIDISLFQAITQLTQNDTSGGSLVPVVLPPLKTFEDDVPAELKVEIEEVRQKLADGSLSTGW